MMVKTSNFSLLFYASFPVSSGNLTEPNVGSVKFLFLLLLFAAISKSMLMYVLLFALHSLLYNSQLFKINSIEISI